MMTSTTETVGRLAPPTTAIDNDRISSPAVHIADMDGNQVADLLVKSGTGSGAPFTTTPVNRGVFWEHAPGSTTTWIRLRPGRSNVRLVDLNNDKLIDILWTTNTIDVIWLARPDNTWSASADYVETALYVGTPLVFSDPRVKLGDMTGDGLKIWSVFEVVWSPTTRIRQRESAKGCSSGISPRRHR